MDEHSPSPTLPLNIKKRSVSLPIKYMPGSINLSDSSSILKLKTPKEYKQNITTSSYLPTFVNSINFKQVYGSSIP